MNSPKRILFLDLVLSIFRLNGLLIAEGDSLTEKLGLTHARWKVIGAIALSHAGLTVPGVARVLGQSRQAVQRITDVMVEDGLLANDEFGTRRLKSWMSSIVEPCLEHLGRVFQQTAQKHYTIDKVFMTANAAEDFFNRAKTLLDPGKSQDRIKQVDDKLISLKKHPKYTVQSLHDFQFLGKA